ncbi:FMN-dependent NADH-azoreductase [Clostridium estertheticum]|uniref:FMN dependent NADH:quinone oxidoreductase n=2 Tax=Clostridium estertheticum TaxID=238834 RepID=A0A1J0GDC7_9CLOT|nr:FMN-dependent NADH-azoreductase [Clostridium estertheticum]APC39362.1 FMN-dependent NADH-azoreductase [Clostridium estertheticum subsp. estertheticum]MBU3170556.1 FMN-dependent NADH-azoreductase [Clostridium estertheticum]MBZ9614622.1 FMN-dependent NADH-azoreductase [Clostridium estertheticum subsp. laramiense]MPQ30658.1 FMN-dependent NADH-azoreductase [Clostridium estertheticum]MPQ61334.1 FMN-dependent NADH-azoreductase [Clostridium estertheticum]
MSKILYITANPKTKENSFSLAVGYEFLETYKKSNPSDEIITLDLYKTEVPFIDEVVFSAWGKLGAGVTFEKLDKGEQNKVVAMNNLLDQFIAADKYVFVTPLWNFTIPPMMKAYLDNICIVNKTFKYTQNGPVGLLTDKKAVHIQARGGVYSVGLAADLELGDRYINTILNFIGITDKQSIIVEGMNSAPDKADEIKKNAINEARKVAQKF